MMTVTQLLLDFSNTISEPPASSVRMSPTQSSGAYTAPPFARATRAPAPAKYTTLDCSASSMGSSLFRIATKSTPSCASTMFTMAFSMSRLSSAV